MAAATSKTSPHPGVTLDVAGATASTLAHIYHDGHDAHDFPEPIPWKTGQVGAIAPIDRDTTWIVGSASSPASAASQVPVKSAAVSSSAATSPATSCGSSNCACGSAATSSVSASAGPASPVSAAAVAIPAVPAAPAKKKTKKKLPGSGIPARFSIRTLVWVRRASQVLFFALFMYFLFQTAFRGTFAAQSDTPVRLPLPVEAFLLADPFVAAMTVLSTHTIYRGLLWSVGLLALTLVFGRVFCGWICPFGTLHHFFGWLLPSRRGRGGVRVEANKTHTYQRVKYYLLYAFLMAGVFGSAIGGLFDPICIAVRSIGLGVIPAAQYIGSRALGGAALVHARPVQNAADHAQDFLSQAVWQSHQFYFHQTWLIVGLLKCRRLIAVLR